MDFTAGRRVVAADREQRNLDVVTLADFLEAVEVGTVAAVKDGPAIDLDDKSAEAAVEIGQKSGTPVRARCQRDVDRAELHRLPVVELMHDVEAKVVHQVARRRSARRSADRPRRLRESAPVEMIEMRVRHEDEIDRGQMMDLEARSLERA